VAYWLTGALRELTLDMLSETRLKQQGLFNSTYVKHLLDEHLARDRDNRKELWTLLVFQLWYDKYFQRL